MRQDIQERVIEIIVQTFGVPAKLIEMDKRFENRDVNIDELSLACEEEFGIILPYEDTFEIQTPRQLIEKVEEKVSENEEDIGDNVKLSEN